MLVFNVCPCRIQVNFSFFALIAFCCIFTGAEGGLACLLAVCAHEAAHLAAMVAFGIFPGKVYLSAMGCRVEVNGQINLKDSKNILISLAGPGINWLTLVLSATLGFSGSTFSGASFAMAFIHSLPIEPLDGGLALKYFLRSKYPAEKARKISRAISTIILVPLATLGFLVLLHTRYNYSLLALSVYLMLYLVLKWDLTQP